MVETVRGQVPVDQLGTVLMHEHVFVLNEEIRRNYPEFWDEEARVADAIRRLRELAGRGVDTIVDPTVIGLGRDVERVARINAEVDLNIIAATGLYTYDSVPFFFRMHGPGTLLGGDDLMVRMFVKDITEGIAGTGIKAAFLKCAIEEELTPDVERVLNAVAEAHNRTGVPITVHTSPGHRTGLIAQEVLRRNGVDLGRVVVGHSGDTTDTDYLRELIDNGSFIGMDRFGLDVLLPTDDRVATIAELAGQGLADRMVLAHDASCHIDWFPEGLVEEAMPNWNFTHIHDVVLPALREAGVTEDQLTTMLVDNPRRYFS
ncbi:phosphotriesterase-related protein [Saccharopolyspora sp. TS4A08]|uniref:Phosphotriesterase-related protein n=1 Tax=Saccharopolyspora ipomoeae TaxID=3042027 RepID=A0ABT6PW33_9PSEU|nr:phosphotriesterase-related protein [Saccharopolyspora sp. TS4A08]MDI2032223.1 phosphotriesterase-related protein [Saccharopolyspora sp. TS4A08]